MREAQFAAPAIKEYLEGANRDALNPFARHQLFCEKGIDVLEDVLDSFWEHPTAFALFVYLRHPEFMTDMFADAFMKPSDNHLLPCSLFGNYWAGKANAKAPMKMKIFIRFRSVHDIIPKGPQSGKPTLQ